MLPIRWLVSPIAALALAGCGGGEGAVTVQPASPGGDAGTRLTVVLDEAGDGSTETFTLTCHPPSGEHPDPAAACRAVDSTALDVFAPVPQDVACTEQYGGPQTARVTGTVDGTAVDAEFSRTNGCEIDRWDAVAPLLGSAGGVEGT